MKKIKLHSGRFAIVDNIDYNRLKQFKWYEKKEKYCSYAVRGVVGIKNTKMRMHREILKLEINDRRIIDHKNMNGLDNRRGNLRISNRGQNARNSFPRTARGVKYVYKNRCGNWYVLINKFRGKSVYGGCFGKDFDLAVLAMKRLAKKLYRGDVRLTNR